MFTIERPTNFNNKLRMLREVLPCFICVDIFNASDLIDNVLVP